MKKILSFIEDVIDFVMDRLAPLAVIAAGVVSFVLTVVSAVATPIVIVWGLCYAYNDLSAATFTYRTGIKKFCTKTLQCYVMDGDKPIPFDTWVLRGDSTKIDVKHLTGDTNGDERTEGQENR